MDTVSDDTGQASGSPAGLVAPVRAFAFDVAATLFLGLAVGLGVGFGMAIVG